MRKLLFAIGLVLLGSGLIFTSCSKDDDDDSGSQSFEYNGKTYNLDNGYMDLYGSTSDGVYNIDLYLLSDGVLGSTSTGNGVYFEMYTNSENELTAGTYTYNSSEANFTFDIGEFYMNYDFYEEVGDYTYIKSGTVKVEKSSSIYTITIDCVDIDGKEIKGSYVGSLMIADWKKK